jgi:hypothetical protein
MAYRERTCWRLHTKVMADGRFKVSGYIDAGSEVRELQADGAAPTSEAYTKTFLQVPPLNQGLRPKDIASYITLQQGGKLSGPDVSRRSSQLCAEPGSVSGPCTG